MALLRLAGHDSLNPQFYRINVEPEYSPLDNTMLLIRSLSMREPEYADFLSMSYADSECSDLASLRSHVRDKRPKALAELDQVIALDRPFLAK